MKVVHLIYIHGFQGNDSTFQSFPTDLQDYLSSQLSPQADLRFRSSLYPTYKSVKPLSLATKNFLEWLSTQPPGPVILLGHSMGGLLAAEAATDVSNAPGAYPATRPRRIIGLIAFDCPYLGMHPHVVISGIASLFPKDGSAGEGKTERELNPGVQMVDGGVTDDWEGFKRKEDVQLNVGGTSDFPTIDNWQTLARTPTPNVQLNVDGTPDFPTIDNWQTLARTPLNDNPPTPSPSSSSGSPGPPTSATPLRPPPRSFVDKSLTFLTTHSTHPVVKWARKNADRPVTEGKRWVVERFQFGSCMFEPVGLTDRYTKLVAWKGCWVNYWTQTVLKVEGEGEGEGEGGVGLIEEENVSVSRTSGSGKGEEEEEEEKKKKKKKKSKASKSGGHHFVVLPTALGQVLGGSGKWEKVVVGGADDEVAAHCGLFIRNRNLDYEGLVERVGKKVFGWCEDL